MAQSKDEATCDLPGQHFLVPCEKPSEGKVPYIMGRCKGLLPQKQTNFFFFKPSSLSHAFPILFHYVYYVG